jgi:hypothetical protein
MITVLYHILFERSFQTDFDRLSEARNHSLDLSGLLWSLMEVILMRWAGMQQEGVPLNRPARKQGKVMCDGNYAAERRIEGCVHGVTCEGRKLFASPRMTGYKAFSLGS